MSNNNINKDLSNILSLYAENIIKNREKESAEININSGHIIEDDIIIEIEKLFDNRIDKYSLLENDIKEFLISGEFIFNKIVNSPIRDYSPCTIQYSKALENVIYLNVFKSFIINYQYKQEDRENDFNIPEIKKFAKQLYLKNDRKILSFGEMIYILRNINLNNKIVMNFKKFIDKNSLSFVYSESFIQNLEYINSIRNEAAHNKVLDSYKFKESKELSIESINKINTNI